jgi:hypothetical protein
LGVEIGTDALGFIGGLCDGITSANDGMEHLLGRLFVRALRLLWVVIAVVLFGWQAFTGKLALLALNCSALRFVEPLG